MISARPGWACFPVVRNARGEPKRPRLEPLSAFMRLTPADNEKHDWKGAAGIGVALGKPSGLLNAIDVDDAGLACYLAGRLLATPAPPLMSRTPRDGLHVFTVGRPTLPLDLAVKYPGLPAGKYCLVQLLSVGTFVVVPPTRNYEWLTPLGEAEPLYGDVREVWRRLALAHAMPWTRAREYHFQRRERFLSPHLSTAEIREAMK
jgi:hypothetical protein